MTPTDAAFANCKRTNLFSEVLIQRIEAIQLECGKSPGTCSQEGESTEAFTITQID